MLDLLSRDRSIVKWQSIYIYVNIHIGVYLCAYIFLKVYMYLCAHAQHLDDDQDGGRWNDCFYFYL